jgi:replication fork clamp-binding protein CrfC
VQIKVATGAETNDIPNILNTQVEAATDSIAGDSKDVLDHPIELTVFRRGQQNLTLIDLPGMTRVPLKGQHENIEQTITEMYRRYIR